MKRCPKCQRTYPDDAPGFCVNDGTQLVAEEAPAYDPQKTILASPPPAAPPPPQYNPAPPPPPQQYQAPNEPAGIKPPTQWQPQPQQPQPPPPAWPPPPQQQGQWGEGYYQQPGQQYGAPYAPQAGKGKGLSLITIILGGVSGLLGLILLADYLGWISVLTRDTAYAAIIGAVITGAAALALGVVALISKRQSGKALAIVGMLLSAFSIGFWIYLEVEYGILFG